MVAARREIGEAETAGDEKRSDRDDATDDEEGVQGRTHACAAGILINHSHGRSPDRGQGAHEPRKDTGEKERTARRVDPQPRKAERHGEEHAEAEYGREGIWA